MTKIEFKLKRLKSNLTWNKTILAELYQILAEL